MRAPSMTTVYVAKHEMPQIEDPAIGEPCAANELTTKHEMSDAVARYR